MERTVNAVEAAEACEEKGRKKGWRSRHPKKTVDRPTYSPDIVGDLEPFDERDSIFAWLDIPAGDPRQESYYAAHTGFPLSAADLQTLPRPGSGAESWDAAMSRAMYGAARLLGKPSVVRGEGYKGETARKVPGAPAVINPQQASEKVKWFARYLGADLVGVGPLNPVFVHTHIGRTFFGETWGEPIKLSHPHAITVAVAMNLENLRAPRERVLLMLETGLGYSKVAHVSVQLAMLINSLGYSARAHNLRNYQVLSVPVAVDAGLGEMGRCGYLVNPELGNNLRLATVTTDMPLAYDGALDFGLQLFCSKCQACVKACPPGAILGGAKVASRGVRKWKVDPAKCYRHWHDIDNSCVACIVACPWTSGR